MGYSPRGRKESDTTERLYFTSLLCWVRMCIRVQSLQLCPALCYPVDCSLPDSSVHSIIQAGVLE